MSGCFRGPIFIAGMTLVKASEASNATADAEHSAEGADRGASAASRRLCAQFTQSLQRRL